VAYLQGELRAQQEAVNKKQHELLHAHQECSRLASELTVSSTNLRQARAESQSLTRERDELIPAQQRSRKLEQFLVERDACISELTQRNQHLEASRLAQEERIQQITLELATSKATAIAKEAIIERIQEHVAGLFIERSKEVQGAQAQDS
jgi:hypothetical protein